MKENKPNLIDKFYNLNLVKKTIYFLDHIIPPGFNGASLFSVSKFFFRGIISPKFNLYAGSLSWNFFLAIFPFLMFLFTLIAYLPGKEIQKAIMSQLDLVLPNDAYKVIKMTIKDIVSKQRSGLLSFGILTALYFASNGIFSMMVAFDSNFNDSEKKKSNFFKKRSKSIVITIGLTLLVLFTLSILVGGNLASSYIIKHKFINKSFILFFVNIIQLAFMSLLILMVISSLYYYGTSAKKKWKFISSGAIFATVLSIISTYLFSNYVDELGNYNKLYGSIGAVIVLMLVIYFNTMCILLGFELNKSIDTVVKIDQEKRKKQNILLS